MSNRDDWSGLVLILTFAFLFGLAGIWGTIVSSRHELERAKIVQQEKSERGHWLWGHATDKLKARAK